MRAHFFQAIQTEILVELIPLQQVNYVVQCFLVRVYVVVHHPYVQVSLWVACIQNVIVFVA
jgi:hypothetical protein